METKTLSLEDAIPMAAPILEVVSEEREASVFSDFNAAGIIADEMERKDPEVSWCRMSSDERTKCDWLVGGFRGDGSFYGYVRVD